MYSFLRKRCRSKCRCFCLNCPDIDMFIVYPTHANPLDGTSHHIRQKNILESIEQFRLNVVSTLQHFSSHSAPTPFYTFAVKTAQYLVVSCDIFMILGHPDRLKPIIKVLFQPNDFNRMILFRYVTSHL